MSAFDTIILIIFILFVARGVWTGFICQISFLSALILGFLAAGRLYPQLAVYLDPYIAVPELKFFVTYTVLFLLVYLTVMAIGMSLKKIMSISLLGGFDRTMGGLFGFTKAFCLTCLIFIILSGVLSSSNPMLRQAFLYPYLETSTRVILQRVGDDRLRDRFLPKKPAITSFYLFEEQMARLDPLPEGKIKEELTLDELRHRLAEEHEKKYSN